MNASVVDEVCAGGVHRGVHPINKPVTRAFAASSFESRTTEDCPRPDGRPGRKAGPSLVCSANLGATALQVVYLGVRGVGVRLLLARTSL